MKKIFLIVIFCIVSNLNLQAAENTAVYVFQLNEESIYIVKYSESSNSWGVYRLRDNDNVCPSICDADELMFSNEERGVCMTWALSDLGYNEGGYPRYWGDYREEHLFYVINNYSYDYVRNYVENDVVCPHDCVKNRFAGNQTKDFLSVTINTNQVFHTEMPVNEVISMVIYDYAGKIIYSNSIAPNNSQVSIDAAIIPGVYFISIGSNTENKTIKALIN